MKPTRQLFRLLIGPVAHDDALDFAVQQMLGRQFAGLPRPQDQNVFALQLSKYLPRQLDRSVTHGNC